MEIIKKYETLNHIRKYSRKRRQTLFHYLYWSSNKNQAFQQVFADIYSEWKNLSHINFMKQKKNRYASFIVPRLKSMGHSSTMLYSKEPKKLGSELQFFDYLHRPGAKFIHNSKLTKEQYEKFVTLLYKSVFYAESHLKGPSASHISKKSIVLPEPRNSKKKFLMLDLDETLVHSVFSSQTPNIRFTANGTIFQFNIRPYCFQFLQNMSKIFNIYIFTASTIDYAVPIVQFLAEKTKAISGILHRKDCMETKNGHFIKDLRIIQNRDLKDIIIVDNLVHSFGLQLNNGIPIIEFTNNFEDVELKGLEMLLIKIQKAEDVRDEIRKSVNIQKILEYEQTQFCSCEKAISEE